jgi:hypothetical protein
MKLLKVVGLLGVVALLGAGIQHGQFHLYNGMVPHVHENGVVHSH